MAGVATPDIVLVIVILLSAVLGLLRGLVKELLSLVIWAFALAASLYLGAAVGAAVGARFGSGIDDGLRGPLGFATVFVLVLVAGALVQWAFARLIESTGLTGTDRLLGFLFGGARGMVVCTVALIVLRPFAEDARWWHESRIRPELARMEEGVLALVAETRSLITERNGPESVDGEPY